LIFKSYANIIAEHSSARAIPNGNAQAMLIASMQNFQYMYYNVTKEPSSTGINYVLGGSHCNFTFQGPDGEYKLAGGVQGSSIFSPLFIPNGKSHYYDCSSFTSLIVFNTGMFDPAKKPLALDSSLMQ
jgi:hypothetical protein